jgi:hypothetical protein
MEFATPRSMLDSLRGYPWWFVAAAAFVAITAAVWVALKLLKWGIWLALIAVIVAAGFLLLRALPR